MQFTAFSQVHVGSRRLLRYAYCGFGADQAGSQQNHQHGRERQRVVVTGGNRVGQVELCGRLLIISAIRFQKNTESR